MAMTEQLNDKDLLEGLAEVFKGFLIKETDIFRHQGKWTRLYDLTEFAVKLFETKLAVGYCSLFIYKKRILWVSAPDGYYYFELPNAEYIV